MAQRIRIRRWNTAAFRQIRTSPQARRLVEEHTTRIAGRLSDHYGWSVREGKSRYRGIVFTADFKGRVDNLKHNSLLKAMW